VINPVAHLPARLAPGETAAAPRWDAVVSESRPLYFLTKRILDVVVSLVILVVAAPLMLIIAVAIKLETEGPVFFSQERMGATRRTWRGRAFWEPTVFRIYKFRSMVVGADPRIHEAHVKAYVDGRLTPGGSEAAFKLAGDSRVTRVGRFLRRTSLDELPQLINVLKAEMSLVGPRPLPLYEVVHHRAEYHSRFASLPGITGPWQVSGRCQLGFEEMISLDLDYVREQSLRLDLKLLARTVPAVWSTRGAG
jgi:lipopolysaccharide/colanic/teichoic acid biosynthesis glycosyltransferase